MALELAPLAMKGESRSHSGQEIALILGIVRSPGKADSTTATWLPKVRDTASNQSRVVPCSKQISP